MFPSECLEAIWAGVKAAVAERIFFLPPSEGITISALPDYEKAPPRELIP
jgi:hypothetical protein